MTTRRQKLDQRTEELLVDQATVGLDESQTQELLELLNSDNELLHNEFMETAALVQLGMLAAEGHDQQKMPDSLRRKILMDAGKAIESPTGDGNIETADVVSIDAFTSSRAKQNRGQSSALASPYLGWAVAAMLALAFVLVRTDVSTGTNLAEQRADLIANAGDTIVTPWATPEKAKFGLVTGDVVWSDEEQTGYMRLAGMPANDPSTRQYQLWIIDPERSAQPVDGGVFNIPEGSEEVVIPIDAKLRVDSPTTFAITLEQPGGVVVSGGPLLIVAAAAS